jgi:hypothetical protein
VLPCVVHLKWGWHRVERAMERGKLTLDDVFDGAFPWCPDQLDVDVVRLGALEREGISLDSSTIARLRCQVGQAELLGTGSWYRARRAVRGNIVAAAVRVAVMRGVSVGLVRRVRFGVSCEAAVEKLCADVPKSQGPSLVVVDAGIATKGQGAAATRERAFLGRLRIHCPGRCAPPPPHGTRGRDPMHGPVLHPGRGAPEVTPDEESTYAGAKGAIRLRRWQNVHYEGYEKTLLDGLRVDDPAYERPLLRGPTARELTIQECAYAYPSRWPVETLFSIGEETTATEKPRAWTEQAVERRIGLGLLRSSLRKAIAATGEGWAMGPWEKKPQPTAGRFANHLESHAEHFAALALKGVAPRNYRKNPKSAQTKDLQYKIAA